MKTDTIEPEVLDPSTELPTNRADLPVIWDEFRTQAEKLKATAETLVVTSSDQKLEMKLARTTRLEIRQIRIAIEKKRKELGEEYLRKTQKINSAAKELKDLLEPLEERLLEQEEFAEREAAAKLAQLTTERIEKLTAVDGIIPANVGSLTDAEFDSLLSDAALLKQAKIEAARKAEEDRIAQIEREKAERALIEAENARLKAEAVERERLAKIERDKAEAELKAQREAAAAKQKELEAAARKEREAMEAQRKAEADAAAEKQRLLEADARKAREVAEKLAREKAAEAAAELKRKEEEAKAAKKAAAAPDIDKIKAFSESVLNLPFPALSKSAESVGSEIQAKQASFAAWILKQSDNL